MKNELDRQLKEQWEAAPIKDFELHIDTEKLWQKIARPEKQRKTGYTWLKYAAAMLLGAMVTFGLMQMDHPGSMALKKGIYTQKSNKPAIAGRKGIATQSKESGTVPIPQSPFSTPTRQEPGTASIIPPEAGVTLKEAHRTEAKTAQENINPDPAGREPTALARSVPQSKRKTMHLLDLEKPGAVNPKPSRLMMAIEEHVHPKSNDMAFSTRILTKQF